MGRFGYETTDGSTYKLLLKNAKNNRRYMTPAESALWECLRNNHLGVHFRRQHPIYGYIPDFVCLEKRLIIEVDGGYHFIGNQQLSDDKRTHYLDQYGFEVIRFTNEEVVADTDHVINKIKTIMSNRPNIVEKQYSPKTPPQSMTKTDLQSNPKTSSQSAAATPLLRRGRGRLLIFSAPSGSGKSTIVQWLMQEHPELQLYFSISCTSRPPRGTEQNGVEYFFLTPEAFKEKIQNDEFLEYEEVYQDRFYGTLKEQVERQLEAGQNVVFDVDVKGGVNIKKFYGERAMSLFIQPPSVEELRRRLVGRGTDTPEAIENRLAKAEYEMTFAPQFDHIVVNDNLEAAKAETLQLVQKFLNQKN